MLIPFQEGIDKLEITDDGIRLEGVAEFREAVRARDVSAIEVRGGALQIQLLLISTALFYRAATLQWCLLSKYR